MSYFVPYPIADLHSPNNGRLQVRLVAGRLQLTTRQSIYSYEDRYTCLAKTLFVIQERLPSAQKVLILGFGLGSIPMILYKQHGLQPDIVGVDHDAVVLQQFHRFYQADYITLHQADAKDFLQQSTDHFDLICIDLFKDALVPKKFESDQFLEQVKLHLHPKGLVLFNRLTMEPGLATATETFFQHHFSRWFPDAYYVDTGGNWILVGEKAAE